MNTCASVQKLTYIQYLYHIIARAFVKSTYKEYLSIFILHYFGWFVAAFCRSSDLPTSVEEGFAPSAELGDSCGKITHSFRLFQLNLLALALLLSLPALCCVSGKLSASHSTWGIPVTGLCFSLHDLQPKEINQKSHSPWNWPAIYCKC